MAPVPSLGIDTSPGIAAVPPRRAWLVVGMWVVYCGVLCCSTAVARGGPTLSRTPSRSRRRARPSLEIRASQATYRPIYRRLEFLFPVQNRGRVSFPCLRRCQVLTPVCQPPLTRGKVPLLWHRCPLSALTPPQALRPCRRSSFKKSPTRSMSTCVSSYLRHGGWTVRPRAVAVRLSGQEEE